MDCNTCGCDEQGFKACGQNWLKNIHFFCRCAQKWDVEIISILRNLAKLVTTAGAKVRTRTAAGCPECVAERSHLCG